MNWNMKDLNTVNQGCETITRYRESGRGRMDRGSSYAFMSQGLCICKGPVEMKRDTHARFVPIAQRQTESKENKQKLWREWQKVAALRGPL